MLEVLYWSKKISLITRIKENKANLKFSIYKHESKYCFEFNCKYNFDNTSVFEKEPNYQIQLFLKCYMTTPLILNRILYILTVSMINFCISFDMYHLFISSLSVSFILKVSLIKVKMKEWAIFFINSISFACIVSFFYQ